MASNPTSLMANAIRALAMDAVQQANSGHPGAPMGMAEIAVALWSRHLRHNPANPEWANRDRFVLSNGHGSMLLYALLHLTGYALPMSELRNFRQLHSKTAGHPEVGHTPGVETTTGPLGQGVSNAVGMALAEKLLAQEFNRDGHAIVDHHTYVFLGDGCLMEGISHEACALAGAWKLNKLIALYDDNGISIDGKVAPWFIDDTPKRFEAYGWNVIRRRRRARRGRGRCRHCRRQARRPADADLLQDDHRQGLAQPRRHGQGAWRGARRRRDPPDPRGAGLAARAVRDSRSGLRAVGRAGRAAWSPRRAGSMPSKPMARRTPSWRWSSCAGWRATLPAGWTQAVVDAAIAAHQKAETVASRKASQLALEAFTRTLPELLGGSADLTGSNLTNTASTPPLRFTADGSVAGRRQGRAPHQLRRARVRHGGDHERRRAARRLHPLRRHLPDLQRLQPQRDPHGGADAASA